MPHALRRRTAPAPSPSPAGAHATERGLSGWWARNVVALDPHPEPSLLDRLDDQSVADPFRLAPFDGRVQRVA